MKANEMYQRELVRRRNYAADCLEIIRKRALKALKRVKNDDYTLTRDSLQDAIQNTACVISQAIKIPGSKNEVVSWLFAILKKLRPQSALFMLRYGVKSPYSKYQSPSNPVNHTTVKSQSFDSLPIVVKPVKDKINLPLDFLSKKEKALLERKYLFGQKMSTIAKQEKVTKRAVQIRLQNIIAQLVPKKILFERIVNQYGYDREGQTVLLDESKFYFIESYGLDLSDFRDGMSIHVIPRDLRYNLQYEPSSEAKLIDVKGYRQKRFHELNQFKINSIKSDYELTSETIKIDIPIESDNQFKWINRQYISISNLYSILKSDRVKCFSDTTGTLGGKRLSSEIYEKAHFDYIPMTRPLSELRFKTRKHKGITEYLPYYDYSSDHVNEI